MTLKTNIPKRKLSWIILLFLACVPIIQSSFKIFDNKPLKGAFEKAPSPELSITNWFSEDFQSSSEKYTNQNFGFRNYLVRLHNEINFSLFKKTTSTNIFLGKEDFLYRFYSPNYKKHTFFKGEDYITGQIRKLKTLSNFLDSAYNCKIVTVITPAKHYYYEEYLPEQFVSEDTLSNNYKIITKQLANNHLSYVDFNKYYLSVKGSLDFPLYSKGGIHWTKQGAFYSMDSLMHYLDKKSDKKLVNITYTKPIYTGKIWSPDQDIYNTLNIIREWPDFKLQYSELIEDTIGYKPKIISIADSYYHAVYSSNIPKTYFSDDSRYWYYNSSFFNNTNKSIEKQSLENEIENCDFILLFSTIINLEKYSFGFIDEAYSYFIENKKDQIIDKLADFEHRVQLNMTAIKKSPDWYKDIQKKAKERNISTNEMLRLDAEYMANQQMKK